MKLSIRYWRGTVLMIGGVILLGCWQREALPTAEDNATADQHLPFQGTSDTGGVFPTGTLTPAAIPAGTPLTIHLQAALSSATSRPSDPFEAILDEPIIVRGNVVAPRGAILAGKVLDAKASDQLHDPGYLRLALTAISLNGKSVPILTSSIFVTRGSHEKRNPAAISSGTTNSKGALISASVKAAGTAYPTRNKDVGVAAERHLTFHLAQPLPLEF